MDDLPPALILEILGRLGDSADLARCRLVSRALNFLSCEVRSINLHCSSDRYAKSRSPEISPPVTPFKSIFKKLISNQRHVESVAISVWKPRSYTVYDDLDDESDDLYLTADNFVGDWLPGVGGQLRSISVSDFWIKSCWRQSEILSFISSFCHSLVELELKNAWLSVERLNQMPSLTSLTLEFIRLDDEDLDKLNSSFPSLRVLKLIGVGGLKDAKVQLSHLTTCEWVASNAPSSLTIFAPKLAKLRLNCVRPKLVVIDAPLLSDFHLSIEKANNLVIKGFLNLQTLKLVSKDLCGLFDKLQFCRPVETLLLDSMKSVESNDAANLTFERLIGVFPNAKSLTLGPEAWLEAETSFQMGGSEITSGAAKGLKDISARVFVHIADVTLAYICYILKKCVDLQAMSLLVHRGVQLCVFDDLVSRCVARGPRVRWKWGFWSEGMKDIWALDGI